MEGVREMKMVSVLTGELNDCTRYSELMNPRPIEQMISSPLEDETYYSDLPPNRASP
jgi:hypothetical protein